MFILLIYAGDAGGLQCELLYFFIDVCGKGMDIHAAYNI